MLCTCLDEEFFCYTMLWVGCEQFKPHHFLFTMKTLDGKAVYKAKCPVTFYENGFQDMFSSWNCAKVHIDFVKNAKISCGRETKIPFTFRSTYNPKG